VSTLKQKETKMSAYNPANWFWVGQPVGQSSPIIYSSAAGAIVSSTNGNPATSWPKDETGAITTATLDAVLIAAGLPPTGLTPATKAQLQAAMLTKVALLQNISRNYTVAGVTPAISCDIGPSQGDVQDALLWGNTPNQTGTLPWIDNNFVNFSLTPAEAIAFATAVGAYKQLLFAESTLVNQGINSGSITTLAQIALASWPI
jgi:hypothetical protein